MLEQITTRDAIDCPPSFQPIFDTLVTAHGSIQALWRYALVLLLIDQDKARFIDLHQDGETLHMVVRTSNGERFSVIRPPMSEETEQLLLQHIREIEIEQYGNAG